MRKDRSEPNWNNQRWHAKVLLATKGIKALYSPHAATGKICRCGECFCCAALEIHNEARGGPVSIDWSDVEHLPVKDQGKHYTAGDVWPLLVTWGSKDARRAQKWLRERAAESQVIA